MEIEFLRLHPAAVPPVYAHDGDAGADLVSVEACTLAPGQRGLVGTGLAIALPSGTVGLVTPRSGLAARTGLSIVNSPGVIDAGYRGEIKVCLLNTDHTSPIEVRPGDRIAQLLIQRVEHARFLCVEKLGRTERGQAGHGSTGGAQALDAPATNTRYGESAR